MVLGMQNRVYWNLYWSKKRIVVRFIDFIKNEYFLRVIYDYLRQLKHNSKILEVGCGNGNLLEKFYGKKIIGIDISPIAIKMSKKKKKNSLTIGDIFNLNFNENTFDLVFSNGLIEHYLDQTEQIIREKYRVAKKGGYIVSIISNNKFLRNLLFNFIYFWDKEKVNKIKNYKNYFESLLPKISNEYKIETLPRSMGTLMVIKVKKC